MGKSGVWDKVDELLQFIVTNTDFLSKCSQRWWWLFYHDLRLVGVPTFIFYKHQYNSKILSLIIDNQELLFFCSSCRIVVFRNWISMSLFLNKWILHNIGFLAKFYVKGLETCSMSHVCLKKCYSTLSFITLSLFDLDILSRQNLKGTTSVYERIYGKIYSFKREIKQSWNAKRVFPVLCFSSHMNISKPSEVLVKREHVE